MNNSDFAEGGASSRRENDISQLAGALDIRQYPEMSGKVYQGIAMYARDVNLSKRLSDKYAEGLVLREKAATDASGRFMGMVTSHRYVILSNHMADLTAFEQGTGWGQHSARSGSRFKVLGQYRYRGKTGIFLLHLPEDESWRLYQEAEFSIDRKLYAKAVQRFIAKCGEPPAPELTTNQWLNRCAPPVGMDIWGNFQELEEPSSDSWAEYRDSRAAAEGGAVFRYYRLPGGMVFKIDDRTHSCYRLGFRDGRWHLDLSLYAEFLWGGLPACMEILMEDNYETDSEEERGITEILIGRKEDCDLCLPHLAVSRYHASIYYDGSRWLIRDLGSTNGILLNGKQVGDAVLQEWDKIGIGPYSLTYRSECLAMDDGGTSNFWFFPRREILEQERLRQKHSRYLGCLLGAAVGDALGYPLEFMREQQIFNRYGDGGIQALEQAGMPAKISDDTQMALFAANAVLYAKSNPDISPEQALWTAYREWLGTQGDTRFLMLTEAPKMWIYGEDRLHSGRMPGATCLESVRGMSGRIVGSRAENDSKGCGTVMRAACFGLAVRHDPVYSRGDDFIEVRRLAMSDAALTHGNPAAWEASAVLAEILFEIVQHCPWRNYPLEEVFRHVGSGDPEVQRLLQEAVRLAGSVLLSDQDGIHMLGEGWVAEEALAIAVFCAVRYQKDFARAVRAAVNHRGNSDSTGAICGCILGAWLGREAVEAAFDLSRLELADVIISVGEDLYRAVERGVPEPGQDVSWDRKYRGGRG